MAYCALEESVALLEGRREPAPVLRLSRRVRHLPVAVDRDGDVAAALFLRRGVSGEPLRDVHTLEHTAHGWRLLGGGGGSAGDVFTGRPSASESGLAVSLGGGGTARNADRLMPWGATWVRWAELWLAAEVAALQVGSRVVPVAPHGLALVVWGSRRRPPVVALDVRGDRLGPLALRDR